MEPFASSLLKCSSFSPHVLNRAFFERCQRRDLFGFSRRMFALRYCRGKNNGVKRGKEIIVLLSELVVHEKSALEVLSFLG
jgi:hypothetical protein